MHQRKAVHRPQRKRLRTSLWAGKKKKTKYAELATKPRMGQYNHYDMQQKKQQLALGQKVRQQLVCKMKTGGYGPKGVAPGMPSITVELSGEIVGQSMKCQWKVVPPDDPDDKTSFLFNTPITLPASILPTYHIFQVGIRFHVCQNKGFSKVIIKPLFNWKTWKSNIIMIV